MCYCLKTFIFGMGSLSDGSIDKHLRRDGRVGGVGGWGFG